MTYRDIINDAEKLLIKNNIDDAKYDAKQILLTMMDMDMSEYLLMEDRDLEEVYDVSTVSRIANKFDELISLRCNHYPLQYILGEQYFYGLRFQVSEDVLIPRQDTEVLVEKVLEDNLDKNISILDMCTGSGCIAITLANLGGYKTIVASDISRDALEVASQNASEILNLSNDCNDEMDQHIYFVLSDMFESIDKVKETT
ncbi:MAG: peptide chain release factor N(5)-glutamine methyltransferase, partial [Lachnospiraceae bacterium]|nr:peptide chain release factor N(5)-glutamine methyltransferase [Lachnospiraceae bacterium]